MNKIIMNRLTMLAVTLMASMACFAQGKLTTGFPVQGLPEGAEFDHMGVKYKITVPPAEDQTYYFVEAIGFETNLLNDFSLMDEEPLENDLTIFHVRKPNIDKGESGNSFVVLSGAANAFQTADADLAVKIERLIIEYSEDGLANNGIIALPSSGSTFAGLTGLTEVVSVIPGAKVAGISKTSFDANVYKTATLTIPAGSVNGYQTKDGWKRFVYVTDGTVLYGDVNNNGTINMLDYKALLNAVRNGTVSSLGPSADVNGNGSTNMLDYKLLLNKVRGIEF